MVGRLGEEHCGSLLSLVKTGKNVKEKHLI